MYCCCDFLPTKSKRNTLILTSNGCCLLIKNAKVILQDESGNKRNISYNEKIYEHDIFKYKIPNFSCSPIKMFVEFHLSYDDECDFSLPVLEFENIKALKERGVLIYFQEDPNISLNVVAGNRRVSYKMGSRCSWAVQDTPNELYT
jgi:hypothetical protein